MKLVMHLARLEIGNRYKWSRVGSLWPSLSFALYATAISVVFTAVLNQDLRSYLPYLTSGLAAWTFVQSFLSEGVTLLSTYKGYIINVRIPFVVYSGVLVARSAYVFLLQLPIVVIAKILFADPFLPGIAVLPLALLVTSLAGALMAICFSYLGPLFPDMAHLMPSLIMVLWLVTPILYPPSLLDSYPLIYEANPMYYLVSLIREPLLGQMPGLSIWLGSLFSVFALGVLAFWLNRVVGKRIVPVL